MFQLSAAEMRNLGTRRAACHTTHHLPSAYVDGLDVEGLVEVLGARGPTLCMISARFERQSVQTMIWLSAYILSLSPSSLETDSAVILARARTWITPLFLTVPPSPASPFFFFFAPPSCSSSAARFEPDVVGELGAATALRYKKLLTAVGELGAATALGYKNMATAVQMLATTEAKLACAAG